MSIGFLTEIVNYHSGARAPLLIAKYMVKRGHSATVYAYNNQLDHETVSDLRKNGVEIVTIDKSKLPMGKYGASIKLWEMLRRQEHEALLFAGTLPFFFAGKLSGTPIIRIYMGTQFDAFLENNLPTQSRTPIDALLNIIANFVIYCGGYLSYRMSNGVVAISRYASEEGKRLYHRKADAVIYLGTTLLPKFKILVDNRQARNVQKQIEIVSVSRLTPYKGFHLIIEALKKIKTQNKIILTIVGSQPKTNYISYLKKIGGNMLNIVLNASDSELAKIYQRSDIYANADRYLYFGLPIVEAAHFGKPTVSFNFAAAKEVIDHGKTGFIANNIEEFATYLKLLINDNDLRTTLGNNAKRKSKYFSWEKCAVEWENLIEKYLEKKV